MGRIRGDYVRQNEQYLKKKLIQIKYLGYRVHLRHLVPPHPVAELLWILDYNPTICVSWLFRAIFYRTNVLL